MMPLRGELIVQLRIDYALTLVVEGEVQIRIQGPFELIAEGGQWWTMRDPELFASQGVPEVLFQHCLHKKIESVEYSSDGVLVILFEGGLRISVRPADTFEAWMVSGPGSKMVVCAVGGQVSEW